jgi:deoxycytidine triphosphate deaminase
MTVPSEAPVAQALASGVIQRGSKREGRLGVVDLEARLTRSWPEYNAKLRAEDSRIYVDGAGETKLDSPITLSLSVGSQWLSGDEERFYAIPEDGISLKPRQTIIVETQETVATPYNVFGLVTGKGSHIFRAILVSSGKIDPGFHNKLRIGIYNGSRKTRHLKPGTIVALAYFLGTDRTLQDPMSSYETFEATEAVSSPPTTRLGRWLRGNWALVASLIISIASLFVAVVRTLH